MNSPYWFEVAMMFGLTCAGNIVFAPFAEGVPYWRRIAKMFLGAGVAVLVSATAGRPWFFARLGAAAVALLVVHGWWLPRHGIDGWTAQPREKYYALRGWKLKE